MFTFLLASVIVIALAVALVAFLCILQGVEYDRWLEEFNTNPEQVAVQNSRGLTRLCDVLDGQQVVGQALVTERRANRR